MRGYDLVALIFAREVNDHLTGLVKRIDERLDETMTRQKRANRLGVFVVLCTDDAAMRQKLKELADNGGLKQVVLSTFQNAGGPPRYKVARDADLTVAVYKDNNKVSANFALVKGLLDKARADAVFDAVVGVLPK